MTTKGMRAAVALAAVLAAGCAATAQRGLESAAPASEDVAALTKAIAAERDGQALAALLFSRGHAYLAEAERTAAAGREKGKAATGSLEASRLLLGAIRDFEDVAQNFAQSPEAPEALFHLGVAYDYPNLAKFGVARTYYQRTIERYPGTESARKARAAIAKIDEAARGVGTGGHGGR